MVVHFGEREVVCDQRYVALVRRVSKPNTCHILLHASVCVPEAEILESQYGFCLFRRNVLGVVISGAFIKNLIHNHIINIYKKNLFPAKQKTA
jgi:hypothetical protein